MDVKGDAPNVFAAPHLQVPPVVHQIGHNRQPDIQGGPLLAVKTTHFQTACPEASLQPPAKKARSRLFPYCVQLFR